jgi:release factor glutamine methyltransferase
MITRGTLLQQGYLVLAKVSPSPRLDAELLLAHVEGVERWRLRIESDAPVESVAASRYRALLTRRAAKEPVAYLIGEREFYGLRFSVDPRVLIPRPESELLVEKACEFVRVKHLAAPVIADLGTGSGCLICAMVSTLRTSGIAVQGMGVDLSQDAINVAEENTRRLGLSDSVRFVRGEWCAPLTDASARCDVVVANPPYVAVSESVSPEVQWEPQAAVYAPENGLRDIEHLMVNVPEILAPGGLFLCEIGAGKRNVITERVASRPALLKRWDSWEFVGDDSGEDRFSVLRMLAN